MKVLEARIVNNFESPKFVGQIRVFRIFIFHENITNSNGFTVFHVPPIAKYKWNGVI